MNTTNKPVIDANNNTALAAIRVNTAASGVSVAAKTAHGTTIAANVAASGNNIIDNCVALAAINDIIIPMIEILIIRIVVNAVNAAKATVITVNAVAISNKAVATTSNPAPRTRDAAPATAAPIAKAYKLTPNATIEIAPCNPYCTIVGRIEATNERAVAANIAATPTSANPTPTRAIAPPNAINPTAPAVNDVPSKAAPTASKAIAATIPIITAIAPQPAPARAIED